jgi:hypothetical protein
MVGDLAFLVFGGLQAMIEVVFFVGDGINIFTVFDTFLESKEVKTSKTWNILGIWSYELKGYGPKVISSLVHF